MKNSIDFETLSPQIIDEVAKELMPDRPIFHETDIEIRFGDRGSFCVNKRIGAFRDYQECVHGGLLDMICHLCGFDRKYQAVHWMQDKGFIDGTFTRTENHRPQAQRRSQGTERDMFVEGQKLWAEALAIPFYQQHPVRRWCLHRNLFPGYKELPPTIRYHEAKGYIIVALATIQDFIEAYPEPPQPRQFHLISIDSEGNKGKAFKGDDKRTYGQPGVTCIALFGNPNSDQLAIGEGIADALAIFARSLSEATLASITTFHKIKNCPNLIKYLSAQGRSVTLFSDNDLAGRKARNDLARILYEQGGDVFFGGDDSVKDPAEAAAMEVTDE